MIASLTAELTQLRKEYVLEKEKNQESEDLMESTFEKTKKIRKLHEKLNKEKDNEITQLKQRVKEIYQLRLDNHNSAFLLRKMQGEIASQKQSMQKMRKEFEQMQKTKTALLQDKKKLQKESSNLKNRLQNFHYMANIQYNAQQRHRLYILESIFSNIDKVTALSNQSSLTFQAFEKIANEGVEKLLEIKENRICQIPQFLDNFEYIKDRLDSEKNLFRIHRYMSKGKTFQNDLQQRNIDYSIVCLHNKVGICLNRIPFSNPPTNQELEIDWSQVIKISANEVDSIKWQLLMTNIAKFSDLTEIQIENCTANNITNVQLRSIRKLKNIMIFCLQQNLPLQSERELKQFADENPQVNVDY